MQNKANSYPAPFSRVKARDVFKIMRSYYDHRA